MAELGENKDADAVSENTQWDDEKDGERAFPGGFQEKVGSDETSDEENKG